MDVTTKDESLGSESSDIFGNDDILTSDDVFGDTNSENEEKKDKFNF